MPSYLPLTQGFCAIFGDTGDSLLRQSRSTVEVGVGTGVDIIVGVYRPVDVADTNGYHLIRLIERKFSRSGQLYFGTGML